MSSKKHRRKLRAAYVMKVAGVDVREIGKRLHLTSEEKARLSGPVSKNKTARPRHVVQKGGNCHLSGQWPSRGQLKWRKRAEEMWGSRFSSS